MRSRNIGLVEAAGCVFVGGKRCSLPTDETNIEQLLAHMIEDN